MKQGENVVILEKENNECTKNIVVLDFAESNCIDKLNERLMEGYQIIDSSNISVYFPTGIQCWHNHVKIVGLENLNEHLEKQILEWIQKHKKGKRNRCYITDVVPLSYPSEAYKHIQEFLIKKGFAVHDNVVHLKTLVPTTFSCMTTAFDLLCKLQRIICDTLYNLQGSTEEFKNNIHMHFPVTWSYRSMIKMDRSTKIVVHIFNSLKCKKTDEVKEQITVLKAKIKKTKTPERFDYVLQELNKLK